MTPEQKKYYETAKLRVSMPDGSKWDIPVNVIADSRAKYYHEEKGEFASLGESLSEDTIPLFMADPYNVHDWASGNMNWSDVEEDAVKVSTSDPIDFDEGWVNGDYEVKESK